MNDNTLATDPQYIHSKLVTTQVEMMHVAAVRGICNLEEVGVPAQHEFDDNDNFATHALGYYNDEPISAVRMRFFGDFVKLERACVRPKYRNRHILPCAIDLVSRFAGQKGYRQKAAHFIPEAGAGNVSPFEQIVIEQLVGAVDRPVRIIVHPKPLKS